MTKLDGFESRLLQALIEIDAESAERPSAAAAAVRHRESNARRKRRFSSHTLVVPVVALLILAFGATAAAASGLFAPAPPEVIGIFKKLQRGNGEGIDSAKAVRVGVIDDHVAYAAPTADGGFCLYFAPNPRSGPTGTSCIARGARPGEVMFSVLPGTDGGLLFGRVGGEGAVTVKITFPDGAGTLTTPVADSGFFGTAIPNAAMRTMMIATQPGPKDPPTKDGGPIMGFVPERMALISVAAFDPQGTRIASGVPVTLPEAETGTGSGASPTPSRR